MPISPKRRTTLLASLCLPFFLLACSDAKKDAPAQPVEEEIPMGDAGKRMYFKLLCDKDHGGMCAELALMHQKGWGGKKDKEAAKRLYRKACDLGNAVGCQEVGEELSYQKEMEIHKAQCELNNPTACNNYGHLLWMGPEIKHDLPKAREAIVKGCELGVSKSCRAAIRMFGKGIGGPMDKERAKAFAEKAKKTFRAEQDLEMKYLHKLPKDQLPVAKAPESWGKKPRPPADAGPKTEPDVY